MKQKLLVALLFGLGSMTFAATAVYADSSHSNNGNDDHENEGSGSTTNCSRSVVSACGLQIVKFTCQTQGRSDDDENDSEEHQNGESDNRDNDKDNNGHSYTQDDEDSPSNHPGQDYSFDYTDPEGVSHHVTTSERMGTAPDGKLTICHRMGGAEVTLNIPDDQINGVRAHGHGDHDMDTIGRCEDQEDAEGHDDPAKVAAAPKVSQKTQVTSSVTACLAAPAGTAVTVNLANGTSWTGTAPGCNASGVSCQLQYGGSITGGALPNSGAPNRGAVKTLR